MTPRVTDGDKTPGISRGLVLLLATAAATGVANMYYAQPLLHTLGDYFGVGAGAAGLLVTLSQIGYVIGLALLVPLGDLLERRRLITVSLLVLAAAEVLAAGAPTFAVFGLALMLIGLSAFVVQVIVPLSAHLAADNERGQVVGTVMSGLLIGILLSRTASGLIAEVFGWRAVFGFGAVLMVAMAVLLRARLPKVAPTSDHTYGGALLSVLTLIREEPLLRQRMALGACSMGCFSVLWTSLAFLLAGAHGSGYHYGNATIGLFGLAGVAGAAAAQIVGRLGDRGHGGLACKFSLLALLASWGLLALGAHGVVVLIVGIMVLDLGVQGTHVANQSAIYTLAPDARSRLTTAYMVAYFLGGVLFSSVTGALYAAAGWYAVCALGAGSALLALLIWALTAGSVNRSRTGRSIAA